VRILVVTSYFPPHVGGVEVVAERQARVLSAAGHDVVVATSRFERSLPAREHRDGYVIHRFRAANTAERRLGIPYPVIGLSAVRDLRRLVAEHDVVHIHDVLYQPSQAAAMLAVAAGRPLYATQHVGPVNHPHPVVRLVERSVDRFSGGWIRRRAHRFVSYNPMVAAHLLAGGVPAGRIVHGHIGVDTTTFHPAPADPAVRTELGLPADVPLVLFVGRLVDKKGYRHLLRAARPDRHIVLVGPGEPAEPLPPGVTHTGPLDRSRLVRLYRAASAFVLPSTGEVFPIAAQEAMACGAPVVLTDGPQYDRYHVDRDLLRLVPADAEAVDRALTAILGDADLRRRMGAYSRQLAEKFFNDRAGAAALVALYDPVAAPAPTPGRPTARKGERWTSPLSS
jgi:glycosyltransferase involved in cell wall biosynthesis